MPAARHSGRLLRNACTSGSGRRIGSPAKDARTHTHQGAARLDGGLQIRGHAHGQGVEVFEPGLSQGGYLVKKPFGALVQCQLRFEIRRVVWNAHQSTHPQTWQFCNSAHQLQRVCRCHTGLGGAAIHIHLNTHLQGRQVIGPLGRQALGGLEPVYGVRPVKVLGHQARLVALNGADAVPLQRRQCRIGAQQRHFFHGLLDVVFTKRALTGQRGIAHRLGAKSLGNRQQSHRTYGAISGDTGTLYACMNLLEVVENRGHNGRRAYQTTEESVDITQLLAFSVKNKASDLHLSAGLPPMIRVHGDVRRINVDALDHKTVHGMVYDIMSDSQRKAYEEFLEVDFSFEIEGLARFRVNAFNQNRGAAAVFRTIPSKILTLEQLNCPKIFGDLALKPRGLVLVTGPTGSGKSTTLAAMVNYLNETEYGHILTVEDPIEFVHESKKCLINQREVGPHTHGFAQALRSALREDPDAILVGEMRDLETIRLAMTAAETGHLVFGTLHTSSAAKTIDRIIDVFPADEKEMVRAMLSESLQAVISQTLCKTKDGQGRIAAHEIMLGTSAIRNLIREAKVAQMYSTIQTSNSVGMQTLDQNLTDLVRRNIISPAEARSKAKIPENFPG